ncbi:hypothetical protein FQA39_LY12411 [Lamprigera yunnana]|nr:hypothetical protein FQA39_LY12411 [Lamprigera yunnana]
MLNLNVGIFGHVDSGKTTLAKALSQVASTAAFDKNPQSQQRGITLDLGFSSFIVDTPEHLSMFVEHEKIQFTLVDCPGHASLIRTIIGGAQIIDLILLVVDVTKGIQTQTAECIIIGEITCPHLIVVLNKIDLLIENDRERCIAKAQRNIKRALHATIFADATIVPISARSRINDSTVGISTLIDILKGKIFYPQRNIDAPFLFAIDHCFSIKGKGTILTGTVLQGSVKIEDLIELPEINLSKKIKSLQMFKKPVTSASAGDRLGICVTQFDPKLIERGIACKSGFTSYIYCGIISAHKIKYFKGSVSSKSKFHISIGYETVFANITCFKVNSKLEEFEFNDELQFINELNGDNKDAKEYILLEFEKPTLVIEHCKVIGSKLDLDIHENNCRIAFWGKLISCSKDKQYKETYLTNLKVYKEKLKVGVVDRAVSENTIIVRNLFKKHSNIEIFINLKVTLSTGETGMIECTFGKNGKVKVSLEGESNNFKTKFDKDNPKIAVTLTYKQYIFSPKKKIAQ